jgi:hypothetical protein
MTTNKTDLDRLSRGFDTWGAELALWPVAERSVAEAWLVTSAEARRMHRDARALDRVLALAPDTAAPRAGLSDSILAAAFAARPAASVQPARAEQSAAVLPMARPRPAAATADAGAAPPLSIAARARSGRWQAAAVLVFALATGVLIGTLDVVPEATGWLLEVAGLESDTSQIATIHFDGLPQQTIDEDQL